MSPVKRCPQSITHRKILIAQAKDNNLGPQKREQVQLMEGRDRAPETTFNTHPWISKPCTYPYLQSDSGSIKPSVTDARAHSLYPSARTVRESIWQIALTGTPTHTAAARRGRQNGRARLKQQGPLAGTRIHNYNNPESHLPFRISWPPRKSINRATATETHLFITHPNRKQ